MTGVSDFTASVKDMFAVLKRETMVKCTRKTCGLAFWKLKDGSCRDGTSPVGSEVLYTGFDSPVIIDSSTSAYIILHDRIAKISCNLHYQQVE